MSKKTILITVAIAVIAIVALVTQFVAPARITPTVLEPTFCTPLAVWWGDVQVVTEKNCADWESSFNCELRLGGGAGVVASQVLTTTCEPLVDVPGTGICGSAVDVCWDTTALDIGDYEVFARLKQTNGIELWYGGLKDAEGHDGNWFHLVDKFTVGQICNIPGQFIINR